MLDLASNVPWTLTWVLVPLVLGAWLVLGGWHCFASDWVTGVLLLCCVAIAAVLILFSLGYAWRLPPASGHPLPQFRVLGFLGGWVGGFWGAALIVLDRAYRGAKNWSQEYASRQRDPKRPTRQQSVGALGALQCLVVLLMLGGYLLPTVLQSLIYAFALGTPVGVLLFLFVWRHRAP